ncbi:hypothetical protein DFJ73DRAFT_905958 [Zopfochytrium polystomum]|nr:hypothetical protein DFJ73DRAFT_905958 [Zopfochytrium polystomum]
MPFLKLQHNPDHGSSPLAGKRPPSDSNGFPATPVETVGDGVYKRGKSQTRWDILKSSAKSVAAGAANDGLGVANGLAVGAVGTAVTAVAGRTAGAAAKIGTGAALGAIEEAGKALEKKNSFKIPDRVKFPLVSIGNSLASGKSGTDALTAGADALSGTGTRTGWKTNPKGIIEHGVSAAAGAAVGQMATTAGAPAALKAPIANAVSGTINGVVDTIAGPPPLGKAGKKLQQAAKKAGKAALAVGEMKGKVTAARIDKGRANAGATKELAKSEAAAKKEAARSRSTSSLAGAKARAAAAKDGARTKAGLGTSSATASGTGLKSQTKGAKDTHARAPSAGTIRPKSKDATPTALSLTGACSLGSSSASFETLNDCSYNNQLKDQVSANKSNIEPQNEEFDTDDEARTTPPNRSQRALTGGPSLASRTLSTKKPPPKSASLNAPS